MSLTKLLVLAPLVVGCGPNTSGDTLAVCAPITQQTAHPLLPMWEGTVFTIVMENKSKSDILGSGQAPFINKLANDNAVAGGYHDAYVHPSEPNYLWMVAGQNFGVLDDDDPVSHHIDSTSHIADQLEMAGLSWKAYQEGMGAPCGITSHGRYAAKHNPFVYFNDVNGWDGTTFQPSTRCNEHVVDYSQFDTDVTDNAIPKYVFITPNLDNDMHDGSIAQGDTWLSNEVGKIIGTDAFNKGGVIFLLWDEGGGTFGASDDPPFIAISPNAKAGLVSTTDYDTSSYVKTVQTILGLDALPCGTDATATATMNDLFTVPLSAAL